jgi:hypothetical protein
MPHHDEQKHQPEKGQDSGMQFKILLAVIAFGLLGLVLKSIGVF